MAVGLTATGPSVSEVVVCVGRREGVMGDRCRPVVREEGGTLSDSGPRVVPESGRLWVSAYG